MTLRLPISRSVTAFLVAFSLASARADAASYPWLSFLPKAERPKAIALVQKADAAFAALSADRERAIAAERSYAVSAAVLAAALDGYGADHDAFTFVLTGAGQGPASAENAAGALADTRRLRWEVAGDVASARYGHASTEGFLTAAAAENGIARNGAALRAILAKRVAALPKTKLAAAVKAMEERVAAHPDCPRGAFAALRAAAGKLDAVQYRAWALALTSLLPGTLAADATVGLGASDAETAFRAAKGAFVDGYAALMTLRESLPAAAAAAWYADGYSPRTVPGAYGKATPQSLSSLSSFLRNLAAMESDRVAAGLAEEESIAAAFAECAAVAWVAATRSPARFSADIGLEPAAVRRALGVAWRATSAAPPPPPEAIDRDAVYRAEAAAARIESQKDAAGILGIFAELRRDPQAFEALRIGARYAAVRDRTRAAYAEVLSAVSPGIEAAARKSPAARVGEGGGGARGEAVFRLLASGGDPFSPIAIAAVFEREAGGLTLRSAVPPSALVGALAPLSGMIECGALAVALPCLVEGGLPSADELALLGAGLGWKGAGEAIAETSLRRLCGRYGLPSSFVLVPPPGSIARRYAACAAAALRFADNERRGER